MGRIASTVTASRSAAKTIPTRKRAIVPSHAEHRAGPLNGARAQAIGANAIERARRLPEAMPRASLTSCHAMKAARAK